MSDVEIAVDLWAERRRRTAELQERLPFARELFALYGSLLPVQEDAYREAAADQPATELLASYVAELVMPAVVDAAMAAGPEMLRAAISERLDPSDQREILGDWMRGQPLTQVDMFLARASTSPVLEALGEQAAAAFPDRVVARGCPRCGGPPQLSWFAPAAEDLATGRRLLLCARCHASWGYARMTCPCCGEDSSAKLTIYSEEGTAAGERGGVVRGLPTGVKPGAPTAVFPHVRIEACETCRRYLLNVDVAADPAAVPVVDELSAVPLALYARDRGFSKPTPNLMGF